VSTATLTSQPTLKAPRTLAPWQKLIAPLVTPDVFDFWAGQLNRSWSWSTPMARITERRDEARDTVTLVLRTNRHCADIKPGQHVMVGAQVNGRLVSRSYSPSCIDTAKGLIEITVKRVEGGALSTHLCRDAQVGEVLTLGQVFGDMVWPRQAQGGFLFLAAGSGGVKPSATTLWARPWVSSRAVSTKPAGPQMRTWRRLRSGTMRWIWSALIMPDSSLGPRPGSSVSTNSQCSRGTRVLSWRSSLTKHRSARVRAQ